MIFKNNDAIDRKLHLMGDEFMLLLYCIFLTATSDFYDIIHAITAPVSHCRQLTECNVFTNIENIETLTTTHRMINFGAVYTVQISISSRF